MKTDMRVFLSAMGVAALLAFPDMTKAQVAFQNPIFPPPPAPTITAITSTRRLTPLFP